MIIQIIIMTTIINNFFARQSIIKQARGKGNIYVTNSAEIKDWNTIFINCTAISDV